MRRALIEETLRERRDLHPCIEQGEFMRFRFLALVATVSLLSPPRAEAGDLPIGSSPSIPAAAALPSSSLAFVAVSPCRLVDTRGNGFVGAFGPPAVAAGAPRTFALAGSCGIPADAAALSLNFTVTNTQGPGFLLAYPAGDPPPTVSTLNYVAGQTVANAAIVPVSAAAGLTVIAGVSGTDLIIDVNGYYSASKGITGTIFNYTGNATVNSSLAISGSTNAASPNQLRAAGVLPAP
jgi:hypothetical protein